MIQKNPPIRAGIFTTTIEKIIDMGIQETRHFRLAFEPGTDFRFYAGQFVSLFIPTGGERPIKRPYSIDSPPEWKGFIDLCWKRVQGGLATNYLWGLKEGDRLEIQGPLGHFTVKRPLPKRVIFVSTGTGIAPFRAMIHSLLAENAPVEIWNVFGNRYDEDILYKEEFEALAAKHENFHNLFTVSRPKQWKGETQYVQFLLPKYFKEAADTDIYICGLSAMITAVQASALELGFPKERIHFEKYD